ncbi:translation elongation factor-like protein [Elusimicrobiota bacterium]
MEKKIGEVDDFFAHVGVVALVLKDKLNVGDTIRIHGHTTDFTQKVESMQIEHEKIEKAKKGDSIGIKVRDKVRKHDTVYKVIPKKSLIDSLKLLFSKS